MTLRDVKICIFTLDAILFIVLHALFHIMNVSLGYFSYNIIVPLIADFLSYRYDDEM